MAEVQVDADQIAADVGAQPLDRFGIVAHLARVKLQGDVLYAMLGGESGEVLPIRNEHFFPLPLVNQGIVHRPAHSDPVDILGVFVAAGAAGEADDGLKAHFFGQQHRVAHQLVGLDGLFLVRGNGVAVAGKRRDFQVIALERFLEGRIRRIVGQQFPGVAHVGAGLFAAAELDHLHSQFAGIVKETFKREIASGAGKQSGLHTCFASF